jgi:DNA-binding SARP family transcriptional activator
MRRRPSILIVARAVLALAGAAALWLARPPFPHLVGSLSAPISTAELEQSVRWLAWLLALCLVLLIFVRAVRRARRNHGPVTAGLVGVLPEKRPAPRPCATRGAPRASFALTVAAPAAPVSTSDAPLADASAPVAAHAAGDSGISIAVLGPLSIEGIHRKIKRAATYELLAYLAFHPQGGSRDELIEAIWPAQDPKRTRPRFWQSVTEARKALGEAWIHNGDRYMLDRSMVRVDLDELDRLLTTATGRDDEPTTLERALALWRGEPLDGADYLWADAEIRNLSATLVDLLDRVGRLRLANEDARGALQMAEQAIALDGLHESSWRLALEAEHLLGLRESITRRYAELERSLDEQLGLEPARETRIIYRQLLGQG